MIKTVLAIIFLHTAVISPAQIPDSSKIRSEADSLNKKFIKIDSVAQPARPVMADTVSAVDETGKLLKGSSGIYPTGDLRSVDGLFLGIGYKTVNNENSQSERSFIHKVALMKNLKSEAIQFKFNTQWPSLFRNTDLNIDGFADWKGNILNYFGRGNETKFDESLDFRTFYRVKFSLFQLDPSFRFNFSEQLKLSIGPSLQYFKFDPADNTGRFINDQLIRAEYEQLQDDKFHGGLIMFLSFDKRNDRLLPSRGLNFSILNQAYTGFNGSSNSFFQVFPQVSFYKALDSRARFVLAERLGAGITTGDTEFYQSAFLGSQDNLLGYRKFRFAGDHLAYNNLELRITALDIRSKRRPWKAGLIGFYDIGRVWIKNETSGTIHQGYGGGLFLAPLNKILLRAVAGFSNERMQITAAVRQRF